jgi:hypothetical protein
MREWLLSNHSNQTQVIKKEAIKMLDNLGDQQEENLLAALNRILKKL